MKHIFMVIGLSISHSGLSNEVFRSTLPNAQEISKFDLSHSWIGKGVLGSKTKKRIVSRYKSININTVDVYTKDDIQLETVEYTKTSTLKPSIWIIHFNGENQTIINHHQDIVEYINRENISYTTFNYRTTGRSGDGNLSFDNLVLDGISQVERILSQQKYRNNPEAPKIILYGRSLGGSVATRVAHYYQTRNIHLRVINDGSPEKISDKILEQTRNHGDINKFIVEHSGWAGNTILNDWKSLHPSLILYIERNVQKNTENISTINSLADAMRSENNLHGSYINIKDTTTPWFHIKNGLFLPHSSAFLEGTKNTLSITESNEDYIRLINNEGFHPKSIFSKTKKSYSYKTDFGFQSQPVSMSIRFHNNLHNKISSIYMRSLLDESHTNKYLSPLLFMSAHLHDVELSTKNTPFNINKDHITHNSVLTSSSFIIGTACVYYLQKILKK